ncbi:MAG: hypothetical protein HY537_15870 [Deltaproteobacteria bacterium]|nr:hypothetical protein [Deltaproteobacteria bacterium]
MDTNKKGKTQMENQEVETNNESTDVTVEEVLMDFGDIVEVLPSRRC